jgi:hypothetical protein
MGSYDLSHSRDADGVPRVCYIGVVRKIANRVEGTRMAAEKLGIDVPTAA